MRSTKNSLDLLQNEMILYATNLEIASDLEDKKSMVYYDVLLMFTMKQIENIYKQFVEEEPKVVGPFCDQVAKGLLERVAHLQLEDYQSFIRLFIDELFSRNGIVNYQVQFCENLSSSGEVSLGQDCYVISLSQTHFKDMNIRFNLETIFLQYLKIKQMELKNHPCDCCYQKLKQKKIELLKEKHVFSPYFYYDFEISPDSNLGFHTNLMLFQYVDKISRLKRKELEKEMKRKIEKMNRIGITEVSHTLEESMLPNSYDLQFDELTLKSPEILEHEILSLEYQLKGKRRTLLDIFLSRLKLQQLLQNKNRTEEELEKAKQKIAIYNDMIHYEDFPFQEVGDVILFLFTSFLLDKEKRMDEELYVLLLQKYKHMISMFWFRFESEYASYRNLILEIEKKLVLQMRKNKSIALKDYHRFLENESQFTDHITYFEQFQKEMEDYFQLLKETMQ